MGKPGQQIFIRSKSKFKRGKLFVINDRTIKTEHQSRTKI